jgi:hypothetical protein
MVLPSKPRRHWSLAGQLHGLGAMSSELHPTTRTPRATSNWPYPFTADSDYRLLSAGDASIRGHGQIKAMSGTSVWFESDKALRVGVLVELGVTWPVLLDNKIPLRLVIHGRTVSTDGKSVEVAILRHEFRTRALSSPNQRPFRTANTTERALTASA